MALVRAGPRPFAAATAARPPASRPLAAPSVLCRAPRVRTRAEGRTVDASTVADTVRCYMTEEGALVCERLEPGNYKLEAAAPAKVMVVGHDEIVHEETGALKDAPRCDPLRPKECITYCYVLDDGSMVCEGIPAGDYEIKAAGPEDLESMVKHAMALKEGKAPPKAEKETQKTPSGGPLESLIGKVTGIFAQS